MPFDFKKAYRALYQPKARPELVTVPAANYVAVRGQGDLNEPGGAYQTAISVLYAVAYTLKMSRRAGYHMEGYFDYVVPPLEGFWQQGNGADKSAFRWISALRLPDFVAAEDVEWAREAAGSRNGIDCSAAIFWTVEEGLCVQSLHVGPFDTEPATLSAMEALLCSEGYAWDMGKSRLHHEIYLTDPRRTPPEKWRTVLRCPIRQAAGTAE